MRWVFILLIALNLFLYIQHSKRGGAEVERPAPSANDIRLLTELEDPLDIGGPSKRSAEAACGVLTGFEQESEALALRQRLISMGVEARLESVDASVGTDYWVYLPPLVSRQAAVRQLKDLQARNMDSYIITVGALANGISLGIFSRIGAAEALQRDLESIGYDALMRELPRTHRSYRLELDAPGWRELRNRLVEQLSNDFPSMQIQQKPCDRIATSAQVK